MHEYLFFDGKIMPVSQGSLSPFTSAALFGKGIFTTVSIYDRNHFLWEKHWHRLCDNAERATIDLSAHTEETTRKALNEIIEKNTVTNGRARLTFFDESASKIWPNDVQQKATLLITTGETHAGKQDFRLTISPFQVNTHSPLAGVKSCNYLDKILALDEAKSRGFDEAIQVNEQGKITSAAMANVFWLKDNGIFTPSLKTGCLAGTTREFILENIGCREVETGIDELHSADAIFLTSAGLNVVQVAEFGSTKFDPVDHPILGLLPKKT